MTPETKKVIKLVKKWKEIFSLHDTWTIYVGVHTDEDQEKKKLRDRAAYIEVQEEYFRAYLTVNLFNVENDEDLETVIVHELLHIIVYPLYRVADCALGQQYEAHTRVLNESTTERLTKAIVKLNKRGEKKRA